MTSLSSLRRAKLFVSGWVLIAIGFGVPAVLVPVSAWVARNDKDSFEQHVDWANILAFTVGAIGLVLVALDRAGSLRGVSNNQFEAILRTLSDHVLRQKNHLLAELLSTDSLDSRAAQVQFSLSGMQARKQKRTAISYELRDVVDFYKNETHGRLVILGDAGTGKTVLATQLLVGLLKIRGQNVGTNDADSSPIPILLNLGSWDPYDKDANEWLQDQLIEQFRIGKGVAARLVREGWIIPIADGLDEMDATDGASPRSHRAVERINDYIAATPNANIVIVSRTGSRYYRKLARKVRDAVEVTVERLNSKQVYEYIKEHVEDEQSQERCNRLYSLLDSEKNGYVLLEVLSTPWRLTTAVTFLLDGGAPDDLLPTQSELARSKPGEVDRNYTNRVSHMLMSTFITSKVRLQSTGRYKPQKTMASLLALSRFMSTMEQAGDQSKEVVLHKWWKAFDRKKVLRHHGLFMFAVQHYPMAIVGYFGALLPSGAKWYTFLGVLANYYLIMQVSTSRALSREEPRSVRFARLRTPARAAMFVVSLIVCVLFGWWAAYAMNIFLGIAFGLAATALVTITWTVSSEIEPYDETHPLRPLLNDRHYSILVGLTLGAFSALYYFPIYGTTLAVIFGSMCLLWGIFASAYARYLVAVFYAWSKLGLPLRFTRFLDWGRSVGLLRISGLGYQFRHQELRDFLKVLDQDESRR